MRPVGAADFSLTPRWGSMRKKRPRAVSQMSNLQKMLDTLEEGRYNSQETFTNEAGSADAKSGAAG